MTHDGFPSASIALCLALCSGCPSGQSFVDAQVDDGGTDAATCGEDDVLCPTSGYATWPMPNESDAAIQPASYRVEGDLVVDEITGLIWQRQVDPQTRDTAEAIAYCEGLVLEERDDWRLPGRIELVSLMQPGRSPAIDSDAFPGTPADYFRASTYASSGDDRSWSVYFGAALGDRGKRRDQHDLRALRHRCGGGARPSVPDHGNGRPRPWHGTRMAARRTDRFISHGRRRHLLRHRLVSIPFANAERAPHDRG